MREWISGTSSILDCTRQVILRGGGGGGGGGSFFLFAASLAAAIAHREVVGNTAGGNPAVCTPVAISHLWQYRQMITWQMITYRCNTKHNGRLDYY